MGTAGVKVPGFHRIPVELKVQIARHLRAGNSSLVSTIRTDDFTGLSTTLLSAAFVDHVSDIAASSQSMPGL